MRLETDDRREQLLAVGLEFFGARAYGDVATAEVARHAGVSHGLLFHYFGDKRHYYLEVIRRVAERLFSAQAAPDNTAIWERLLVRLRGRVAFAERYTVAYKVLISGGNGADPEIEALSEEARWREIRLITGTLGIPEPQPELRIALRGWQGFSEGAIIEWLKHRDITSEQLVEVLARQLVATLDGAGIDLKSIKRQGAGSANPKVADT
jgi:AcrR family transcriptional regulator